MKCLSMLVLSSVLLAACESDKPTAPIPSHAATENVEEFYRNREPDEVMTRWARQIPGLSGIYRGDDGKMHIMLTDTSAREVAVFTALSNAQAAGVPLTADRIVVEPSEFSWLQLRDWYPSFQQLLSMPGAILTDIDERRGRLKVGIEDLTRRDEVISKLRGWGIPESAVIIEAASRVVDDSSGMWSRFRPVPGSALGWFNDENGVPDGCTIGLNLLQDTVRYLMTNSHCGRRGIDDDIILKNDTLRDIAVEHYDKPFWTGVGCPTGRYCRFADAALFAYRDSVSSDLGKILWTGYQDTTIVNNFRLSITAVGMICPVPGVSCDYDNSGGYYTTIVGGRTGYNDGVNTSTCIDINFTDTDAPVDKTYLCQMAATYPSAGGDSGSAVWTTVTPSSYTNIRIWGVHWARAGSGIDRYYSLIHYALSEMSQTGTPFTVY